MLEGGGLKPPLLARRSDAQTCRGFASKAQDPRANAQRKTQDLNKTPKLKAKINANIPELKPKTPELAPKTSEVKPNTAELKPRP